MSAPVGPEERREGNWSRLLGIVGRGAIVFVVVLILYAAWCYLIAGTALYALAAHKTNPWSAYIAGSVSVGAGSMLLAAKALLVVLATRGR